MNYTYLSLFIFSVLVLLIILYKINLNKERKTEEVELSRFNGWHYIKLENLKQNEGVIKALNHIKSKTEEVQWRDKFIEVFFREIYFRDSFNLFSMTKHLHENVSMPIEDKLFIKRNITASSVLFNFRVPASLWLFDEFTLEIILKYTILCDTIKVDINNYDINQLTNSDVGKTFFINNIVENLKYGFSFIIKSGYNNRAPNIVYLFESLPKTNLKLYNAIDKDFNNFKMLMTLSYALLNLDIPKDYLFVDKNVYQYLISPEFYSKAQKRHLVSVK